jgi:MFS family permease
VLVGIAFLCDFLLLTVVVPIIPSVFAGTPWGRPLVVAAAFASKPFAQILANPAAGACVARYGPRRPLLLGSAVLVASSGMFALSLLGMKTGMAVGSVFWCCVGARPSKELLLPWWAAQV